MLLLAVAGTAGAQALRPAALRIQSVPAGATVELIGGTAGVTPLTVSERDIYPNHYADARGDMYGMVLLRHSGCESLHHRVTQTDIQQGLRLHLDCGTAMATPLEAPPGLASAAAASVPASAMRTKAAMPAAPAQDMGQAIPGRRLRQLQVLQELLDEGLITPDEEARIRRKILRPDASGG